MPSMPRIVGADDPFAPMFESVSDLTARIKDAMRSHFGEVAVHGEVSNVARPKSGHVYFTLRDETASIRAVLWRTEAHGLPFDLTDGLAVRALGGVTVYEPRGDYQLVVRLIEPEGLGALELAFRQRYLRLAAEGLFDPARKRRLPRFPGRIVVVTSPTGAAVRDILQVTGRRWPRAEILIAPTRVQGEGADREVVAALELVNRLASADIIIVARGGGSVEDLWTFNEEAVARAIAASRVPVVSAIGHEIDVTLADLAADHRALTPSEAGEVCVPDVRDIALHLDRLTERLSAAGQSRIIAARTRLDRLADRSRQALLQLLANRRLRLASLAAGLEALSPLAVLARGYSLTLREDDLYLLRSADHVQPGQLIISRLADGRITSRVESVSPS